MPHTHTHARTHTLTHTLWRRRTDRQYKVDEQVDRCYLDPLDSRGTEPRYRALDNTHTHMHSHTHTHTHTCTHTQTHTCTGLRDTIM